MRPRVSTIRRLPLALALLAAMTGSSLAQSQDFSPAALDMLPTTSWPTNGGNLSNQRYSPLTQVTRENVAGLLAEWELHLGSGSGPRNSGEAQPIVVDGIAYIPSGDNDVFAIDIETGTFKWAYYAELNADISTVCCGWTSRGVGISDDSIFVGQLDGKLVALNRADGSVRWEIQAERWEEGFLSLIHI